MYLVRDLLSDADLFRRLRLRGEASGADGLNDLAAALRLVTGVPYHQLRRRGGLWLTDSRDDNYLTVAIVDTAHLVTTRALAAGTSSGPEQPPNSLMLSRRTKPRRSSTSR